MFFRDIFITSITTFCVLPVLVFCIQITQAQVMQSGSYRIQSDSINFGGGQSSSTNYGVDSTLGEIATGESASASYALKAGYQQMTNNFIAMTAGAPVSMSPSIPGISGGTANGSTTVTVTTDSPAGYVLSIASLQNPAMQKGSDTIPDYVPGGNPDFTFTTNPVDSHFGYTPEGSDVVSRFKDNGSVCGVGVLDTAFACWDGLSTSDEVIAQSTTSNTPNGSTTTVNFRVGIGGSVIQVSGIYTATTTLTALSL